MLLLWVSLFVPCIMICPACVAASTSIEWVPNPPWSIPLVQYAEPVLLCSCIAVLAPLQSMLSSLAIFSKASKEEQNFLNIAIESFKNDKKYNHKPIVHIAPNMENV